MIGMLSRVLIRDHCKGCSKTYGDPEYAALSTVLRIFWFPASKIFHDVSSLLTQARQLKNHRQFQAVFLGTLYGDVIACISMAHDAACRIVSEYALQAFCRCWSAVRDDDHACML